MNRIITATAATALLAACGYDGGPDGMDDAGATAGGSGDAYAPSALPPPAPPAEDGRGDAGEVPPPPTSAPAPADLALDVFSQGSASSDVKAFRFAARKVAFHLGKPTEPLFDTVAGEPMACEARAGTFVRDAPSEAALEFGSADARVRLAGLDLERGGQLVEAWILIERGSARIERPSGQLRSVRLPVCKDEHGTIWSVVRAVSSRQMIVTEDAEATATIDLRASSFIVETASCAGSGAPAECASAEDEGDDGDPTTRLVYTLHSLAMRADGP